MTRAEILDCLTDRPCDVCKFHESGRCERWNCVFEERTEEQKDDAAGMTKEEAIRALRYERKTALHENKSAFDMAIKALSAEPCEDCISRQAVMDALCNDCELYKNGEHKCFSRCEEYHFLVTLPSVTPKQKVGHWILDHVVCDVIYEYHCSACGHHLELGGRTIKQDQAEGYSLFCNGCGAKMAESEDNE